MPAAQQHRSSAYEESNILISKIEISRQIKARGTFPHTLLILNERKKLSTLQPATYTALRRF